MAAYRENCAVRRRRRLGEAAALALALHVVSLGAYALLVRAHRPAAQVIEEIAVDALDEAASRALVDSLAPLPDDTPPPRPPPAAAEVVDQKGDGRVPTEPTRFIAADDSNPEREKRRSTASPWLDQREEAPGRLAHLDGRSSRFL